MTDDDQAVRIGFDFARRLRKREFVDYLKSSGWVSGDHVFSVADSEPVIDVIRRFTMHASGSRAIIAIADEKHRHGFKLLIAERAERAKWWSRRRIERIELKQGSSIGMLYSLLAPAANYVPNEWVQELRFEKVPA